MDNPHNKTTLEPADVCTQATPKELDIIRAATVLFSENGYSGTTTQTIAKMANVSEKTLFKYFSTKQELYDRTVHPAITSLMKEGTEAGKNKNTGIRSILHDLFIEKLNISNEDPGMLKLSIHEFIMNAEFRSKIAEVWNNTYLPVLLPQIELSEESSKKYGDILESGLTRAMVGILMCYAFDKTFIRPDENFNDEKEIGFMLDLLFNGINGLKPVKEQFDNESAK